MNLSQQLHRSATHKPGTDPACPVCQESKAPVGYKYFRVVPKGKYFRLMHLPSGDYVQRHLCDFLTRKDAIECRNNILTAASDWDWSDPGLFQEMPCATFDKVWAAIYNNRRTA